MVRLLGILLAGFVVAASSPPDQDALTREMADRIRHEIPGQQVQIAEPLTLKIGASGSDSPSTIYLDRVWSVCRQDDAQACEESKTRFVASIQETLIEHPPIQRAQLREMIRSQDYCTEVRRIYTEAGNALLTRLAPAGLCAVLVADYPNSMSLLKSADLIPLGLVEDEAWSLAERQTLSNLPEPTSLDIQNGFIIISERDYIPSLIVASDGWRALAQAQGDLVMAVPSDGILFIARASDVDVTQLRTVIAQDFETAERGISPRLYRWTATGWTAIP